MNKKVTSWIVYYMGLVAYESVSLHDFRNLTLINV